MRNIIQKSFKGVQCELLQHQIIKVLPDQPEKKKFEKTQHGSAPTAI